MAGSCVNNSRGTWKLRHPRLFPQFAPRMPSARCIHSRQRADAASPEPGQQKIPSDNDIRNFPQAVLPDHSEALINEPHTRGTFSQQPASPLNMIHSQGRLIFHLEAWYDSQCMQVTGLFVRFSILLMSLVHYWVNFYNFALVFCHPGKKTLLHTCMCEYCFLCFFIFCYFVELFYWC